mmetsp:Transcript_20739/g.31942  ORF Transcript_20739/g.31942 Transcript_20739/m.31942 type:complete len:224 (+) Transcript_20739:2077-2748(+)
MSLTLHLLNDVLEDLDVLKALDSAPHALGDEFERLRLVRGLQSKFFLDERIDFLLADFIVSNHNSEAKHGRNDQLVSFEGSSAAVIEGLEGDGLGKSIHTLAEGLGSHLSLFLFFFLGGLLFGSGISFGSAVFAFFAVLRFAFLALFGGLLLVHGCSNQVNGSVNDNNEGIEREFVEGVDLVQLVEQEEHKGSARSSGSVSFGGRVDVLFGLLGNDDLLLDFS